MASINFLSNRFLISLPTFYYYNTYYFVDISNYYINLFNFYKLYSGNEIVIIESGIHHK